MRDLLELGAWRDVGYGQSSWAPRLNDFYGPANRLGGKPGAGHRFDRIWLRGAVWAKTGFLTGTARRFAGGRPYCLSDHFAVYGLLDVHECHGEDGIRAVRDKRRIDLGQLRDLECDRVRDYVRAQEQLAIDADQRAQVVANEERLQEALRQQRHAVKQRRERHAQLRSDVNGETGLFNAAAMDKGGATPAVSLPSEYCIAAYDGVLAAGGTSAWDTVPGGQPRPHGYDSGYATVSCVVQVLHRLLPVALWLERHAAICPEPASCIVCALRQSRGLRTGGDLAKQSQHKPAHASRQDMTTAMYFEWLLEELRLREQVIACVRMDDGGLVTHMDRLFSYQVESRQECVGCGKKSVERTFERVWRVSTGLYEVEEATVTELFLRSCSVQDKSVYWARCLSDQAHRVQRRLVSLPNIMVIVIDRPRPMHVRAEEQLVLALFGLENLQLVSVCYERGARHSSCVCRGADGD